MNKAQFNNPPLPKTKVPETLAMIQMQVHPPRLISALRNAQPKGTQVLWLQERFLLIQAGIQDERDELLEEISMLENFCEDTRKTLQTVIANDQMMLSNTQTELVAATGKKPLLARLPGRQLWRTSS